MVLAVVHNGQVRARRIMLSRAGVPHDALVCPTLRIFFFPWKKDPNKQSKKAIKNPMLTKPTKPAKKVAPK